MIFNNLLYVLKKLITLLILPSFVLVVLILGSLLVYLWIPSQRRIARMVLTGSIFLFVILVSTPITDFGIYLLERNFPTYRATAKPLNENDQLDYVIVLGGRHNYTLNLPSTEWFNCSSMRRLITGNLLKTNNPNAMMILSGGSSDGISYSEAALNLLRNFNIPLNEIALFHDNRDTLQESARISRFIFYDRLASRSPFQEESVSNKRINSALGSELIQANPLNSLFTSRKIASILPNLLESDRIALVTSAYHMPRSVYLFRQYGINPIVVKSDFLVGEQFNHHGFYPYFTRLNYANIIVREYLGLLIYYIRFSLLGKKPDLLPLTTATLKE